MTISISFFSFNEALTHIDDNISKKNLECNIDAPETTGIIKVLQLIRANDIINMVT